MTAVIDATSEPGAWAQHIRDTACMRQCARCGVGAWHPEVRGCQFDDCEIRAHSAPDTGAGLHPLGSAPGVSLMIAPVHIASVADAGARNHA